MMRCNSFARAAAFAALAAAGWVVWAIVAGPWLGARAALTSYLVAATALYVFALVPSRSRRLVAALAAAAAGIVVVLYAQVVGQLALGLAVIVGVSRGATCHRTSPARAIAIEALLGGTGLLFAGALAGPAPLSLAVALWGYFLVQSCFFLIGGVRRRAASVQRDPFDEAIRQAVALLESEVR